MIVSIKGILKQKETDQIIIDVNGIGYLCFISTNTFDAIPNIGKQVELSTYFHVMENSQQLYAFSDLIEKELFVMLISVSGIGPKTAIILLSAVSAEEFKRRLIAGEVEMLTALPGIGPKTARRIIVELKDKFIKLSKNDLPKESLDVSSEINDAHNALLSLGFDIKSIRNAITKINNKGKSMNTEEIVKYALKELR